jgi:hypothetical protein
MQYWSCPKEMSLFMSLVRDFAGKEKTNAFAGPFILIVSLCQPNGSIDQQKTQHSRPIHCTHP